MDTNDTHGKNSNFINLKIPTATIAKILAFLLLAETVRLISPLLLPLLIAIFLAVALNSIVRWLTNRKCSRRVAIAMVTLTLGFLTVVALVTIVPQVYREAMNFWQNIPQFKADILKNLDAQNPIRTWVNQSLETQVLVPKADQVKDLLGAGNFVLGGLGDIFLIFILSIYLLADGPRIIQWLSAFFSPSTQEKIHTTGNEISSIVSAYVLGQVVTSFLSFVFVFVAMEALHVPAAPLLATLAGLLDVLPVLGFVLAVVPAMLFAANVSAELSWIVLLLYGGYHLVENYFIIPFVYGSRMRVSSSVVFFSLLAAGLIAGIEGAIVVLPIVASYPIIERIWLKNVVRDEALYQHST